MAVPPFATSSPAARSTRFVAVVLGALIVVGLASVGAAAVPLSLSRVGESPLTTAGPAPRAGLDPLAATSIVEVGSAPRTSVVGVAVSIGWEAVGTGGTRVGSFGVPCNLTVSSAAGGSAPVAWVNATASGPLTRSAAGVYPVPSAAWSGGELNVTVSVGSATPVIVRLVGSALPSNPAPITFTVLPDLDHLVLYDPVIALNGTRANDTFWHVRDRFGDPTPGAFLIVVASNATSESETFVPVTWANASSTGAWVNYSAPGPGNGTVRVLDEANATVLGPIAIPALASPSAPPAASLPPLVLVAVALLSVAALLGIVSVLLGGRARPRRERAEEEEELRRLAEGRATIVELVRRSGSLGLHEIEDAWDPPPAPPALADWVASLITDGTLTATIGSGGQARFALAERPAVEEPKVTFDEETLDREIARRDAAVTDEDAEDRSR